MRSGMIDDTQVEIPTAQRRAETIERLVQPGSRIPAGAPEEKRRLGGNIGAPPAVPAP